MAWAKIVAVTGKTEIEMEFDGVNTLAEAERKAKHDLREGYQIQRVHVREIEMSNGKFRRHKETSL